MQATQIRRCGWLLAALALMGGCKKEDTERLGRVGRKLGDRAEALSAEATGQILAGWTAARSSIEDSRLDARVRSRLKWDKTLVGAAIAVEIVGKEVWLKGTVVNLTQRQRAVQLADSTLGVEKVVDQLTIAGP
jgi:hypothetical protein